VIVRHCNLNRVLQEGAALDDFPSAACAPSPSCASTTGTPHSRSILLAVGRIRVRRVTKEANTGARCAMRFRCPRHSRRTSCQKKRSDLKDDVVAIPVGPVRYWRSCIRCSTREAEALHRNDSPPYPAPLLAERQPRPLHSPQSIASALSEPAVRLDNGCVVVAHSRRG
jgi:hypothetical protein